MERHVLFPKLLSKIAASNFYLDNCMYQSEPLKSGTPRRLVLSSCPRSSSFLSFPFLGILPLETFLYNPTFSFLPVTFFHSSFSLTLLSPSFHFFSLHYRTLESILPENCNSYTLSVSFHGFYDPSTLGHRIVPYSEQLCQFLNEKLLTLFSKYTCLFVF